MTRPSSNAGNNNGAGVHGTAAGQPVAAPVESVLTSSDLRALHQNMGILVDSCAEAVSKCVQHYQGDTAWAIGAMPGCSVLADALETRARAFLAQSQLSPNQIDQVALILKNASDLRAVSRGARQAAQLSWLFKQDPTGPEAAATVRAVAEASVEVARLTALAINQSDSGAARDAVRQYREVDAARRKAERLLRGQHAMIRFSPAIRRMTLASVWYMCVAGEGLARVAGRSVLPDTQDQILPLENRPR